MSGQKAYNANRKGQFLWMDAASRKSYLKNLETKIASGYFFSDQVISSIVDEIAPVLEDVTSCEQLQIYH